MRRSDQCEQHITQDVNSYFFHDKKLLKKCEPTPEISSFSKASWHHDQWIFSRTSVKIAPFFSEFDARDILNSERHERFFESGMVANNLSFTEFASFRIFPQGQHVE